MTRGGSAEAGGARLGRIGRRGQGRIWNLQETCRPTVPWEWRGIYGKGEGGPEQLEFTHRGRKHPAKR